jgi:SAM-dependent methyltransferase
MARSRAQWRRWFDAWEEQQESFNPNRERRFATMLDLLEANLPSRFVALDLGCGPGALSSRLLRRFPRARCVAVDRDPVVLRVGQGALGTVGGRLTWVDASLGTPGWTQKLPIARFDVAVSTTALHWLRPAPLGRLYRDLGRLLRRGGLFVNGDRMPWTPEEPELARLAEKVRKVRFGGARLSSEWGAWEAWWRRAEHDPELGPLFPLRATRGTAHPTHQADVSLAGHRRSLQRAGFRRVDVVWRDLEDAILFARR